MTYQERDVLFDEILTRYSPLINSICFSFATKGYEYRDLQQDVVLNIWQGLEKFRQDSSLKTWIYRVAFNTCVSVYRRLKYRQVDFESLEHVLNVENETEKDMDEISRLHTAISMLGPEDKAIMVMWLDDMPYDDIACVTGIKKGTVITRVHRAKEKIKQIYPNI